MKPRKIGPQGAVEPLKKKMQAAETEEQQS
jgi:hypothetical protein